MGEFVQGWDAALEAAARHYDELAVMWAGSARKRAHDDPERQPEMAMSAWWRNTAFQLRGMKGGPPPTVGHGNADPPREP